MQTQARLGTSDHSPRGAEKSSPHPATTGGLHSRCLLVEQRSSHGLPMSGVGTDILAPRIHKLQAVVSYSWG